MKAVTANRLSDGVVVYLGNDNRFAERFNEARLFDESEAAAALEIAAAQQTAVAGAYLIEATSSGPTGREALRETIRKNGPTARKDLGRQAEIIDERV